MEGVVLLLLLAVLLVVGEGFKGPLVDLAAAVADAARPPWPKWARLAQRDIALTPRLHPHPPLASPPLPESPLAR